MVLHNKVFVPKNCLENVFRNADKYITVVLEGKEDTVRGMANRPITQEEARQVQALLLHFGNELCPELDTKIKQGLQEGMFPDEASLGI